jgi:hypothetical protein
MAKTSIENRDIMKPQQFHLREPREKRLIYKKPVPSVVKFPSKELPPHLPLPPMWGRGMK